MGAYRHENTIADRVSKFIDYDDWAIDDQSFALIDSAWGPHSIDRFASPTNKKIQSFNARFWCKAVSGVDAFCQNWSLHNNYLCPPCFTNSPSRQTHSSVQSTSHLDCAKMAFVAFLAIDLPRWLAFIQAGAGLETNESRLYPTLVRRRFTFRP